MTRSAPSASGRVCTGVATVESTARHAPAARVISAALAMSMMSQVGFAGVSIQTRLVWPPLVDLFPHEHKMWSTVGIYGGVEDNTYYRRAGHSIEVNGQKRGEVGDVLLLGADGIHSVRNPTRQWTAAVHVYGGDFFSHPRLQWDPETGEAKPFAVQNARAVLAAADAQARAAGIV